MFNYYKSIPSDLIAARMSYLKSIKSRKELMVALAMETRELIKKRKRELIGRMIMWVLDLYVEGVVQVHDDNHITARVNYLCEKYNMNGS